MSDVILSQLRDAIRTIKIWMNNHPEKQPPIKAMQFLCANAAPYNFYFDRVDATEKSVLREMKVQHRELDEMILIHNCEFARSAISTACEIVGGNSGAEFKDDDADMILRPLEYAKYLDGPAPDEPLERTPFKLEP